MKCIYKILCVVLTLGSFNVFASDIAPDSSHGIAYPTGWQDWSTIAVSHRTDNKTIRMILGNEIAVDAAREGKVNPWPDGSIIGKVVWKDTELKDWAAATVPEKFVHAEFMFKDSKKYADTYNWGWARWVGMEQQPFQKGAKVCTTCHAPVKNRDWVFTDPATLP